MVQHKRNRNGGFIEMVGKGNGPRLSALQQLIAQKQAQLKPIADALTDAYQATVALGAGEDFNDACKEEVPTYIVLAGYDPKAKEYVLKFANIFRGMMEYVTNDEGKLDEEHALTEGHSKGMARLMIANHALLGSADNDTLHEVAPDIMARHCDDEIIPGTSGHSYVEFRSASFPALLDYANAHILNADYAVDCAKLIAPPQRAEGMRP